MPLFINFIHFIKNKALIYYEFRSWLATLLRIEVLNNEHKMSFAAKDFFVYIDIKKLGCFFLFSPSVF